MRSLFVKIFIWFWLAIVLVAGAAFLASNWLNSRPDAELTRMRAIAGTLITMHGQSTVDLFERDGASAVKEMLARWDRFPDSHTLLFDEEGREVVGCRVFPHAEEMARQAFQTDETQVVRSTESTVVAATITSKQGRRYAIVREMPVGVGGGPPMPPPPEGTPPGQPPPPERRPPPNVPLSILMAQPQLVAMILVAVVITGGVVCYGLSRYLTSPVRRLRAATRRLSDGDLGVRVGALVGHRRDELGDLAVDFDVMASRIETLIADQRRLLRDISHELRSPLARLSVALGIARRSEDADAKPALDRIELEADRLNVLIGQSLTLARLESEVGGAAFSCVDLQRLVEEVAQDADFEARDGNRRVSVVASEPCATQGRAELLRSAIENVVRNAVQHTAENTQVEVSLRYRADNGASTAIISVRDHGPGIPEANLREAFLPFHRLDAAGGRNNDGSGLGLAITERAVRVHGGKVSARNADDGGLRIELTLPASNEVG